jgi:hypothetical protein
MQAESRQIGATSARLLAFPFHFKFKPYPFEPLPRTGAGGNPALHRSAVQFCQQRLLLQQRIRFLRIRLRPQATALIGGTGVGDPESGT